MMDEIIDDECVSSKTEIIDEEFKIIGLNNSDSEPDVESKEQVITGSSSDGLNEDALEATPILIHTDTTRKMKKSTVQTYKTMRSQFVQSSSIEVRTTKSTQKNNLQQMDKSDQEEIECVDDSRANKCQYCEKCFTHKNSMLFHERLHKNKDSLQSNPKPVNTDSIIMMDEIIEGKCVSSKTEIMDEEFNIIGLNNSDSEPDVESKEQVITGSSSDGLNEDALEATPKLIHTDTTRKMKKSTVQTYKTMRSQFVQSSSIEVRTTKSTQKNNLQQMDKSDQEEIECVDDSRANKCQYCEKCFTHKNSMLFHERLHKNKDSLQSNPKPVNTDSIIMMDEIIEGKCVSSKTEIMDEEFNIIGLNNSDSEPDVESKEQVITGSSSDGLNEDALEATPKLIHTDTTRKMKKSTVQTYKTVRSQLVQSSSIEVHTTKSSQRNNLQQMDKSDQEEIECVDDSRANRCQYCEKCFTHKNSMLFHERLHKNKDSLQSNPKPVNTDSIRRMRKSKMQANKTMRSQLVQSSSIKVRTTMTTQKKNLQQMDKSDQVEIEYVDESRAKRSTYCKLCNKDFRFLRVLNLHIKKCHSGPATCDVCFKTVKSIVHLQAHIRTHTGITKHSCTYCYKKFLIKRDLQVHERSHTGEKPYKCQYCAKCFKSKGYMVVHERLHENKDSLESNPKPVNTDSTRRTRKSKIQANKTMRSQLVQSSSIKVRTTKSTQKNNLQQKDKSDQEEIEYVDDSRANKSTYCKLCNKDFLNVWRLNLHNNKSHSEPVICDVCFKSLKSIVYLKAHLKTHVGIKKHSCAYCDKNFLKKSNLQVHERSHTGEKPYKCQYCDMNFSTSNGLKGHERTHTGEKPYKCQYCDMKFSRSDSSKVHERTHTGEKPYKCQYCDMKFLKSNGLKVHERTHTGEKPYKCQYCDMNFSTSNGLKGHERTHTGEKPYKCQYCDMNFSTSNNLKGHERTHTGEKPYKCQYCDMNFSTSNNLKGHERTHTGEKPYKCQYCDMKFSRSNSSKVHERTHTGEKPYKCQYCDMKFSKSSGAKDHERTHTGEKPHKCQYCEMCFTRPRYLNRHEKTCIP